MRPKEDVWLESLVITRVTEWCEALRWEAVERGGELLVSREGKLARVEVRAKRIANEAALQIMLAANTDRPMLREEMDFVLRRNTDLATVRWCIDRWIGLTVAYAEKLSTLTADRFRDTVTWLYQERADMFELARSTPREE